MYRHEILKIGILSPRASRLLLAILLCDLTIVDTISQEELLKIAGIKSLHLAVLAKQELEEKGFLEVEERRFFKIKIGETVQRTIELSAI